MSDLLAPLLAALDDEADAFWCFTRLVEGTAFFRPEKNSISVERQLVSTMLWDLALGSQVFMFSTCYPNLSEASADVDQDVDPMVLLIPGAHRGRDVAHVLPQVAACVPEAGVPRGRRTDNLGSLLEQIRDHCLPVVHLHCYHGHIWSKSSRKEHEY